MSTSGPLIAFNDFSFTPTPSLAPSLVFPGLHRSAFSADLLGLFGEEGRVAESSRQGAEKAALVHRLESAKREPTMPEGYPAASVHSAQMAEASLGDGPDVGDTINSSRPASIKSVNSRRRVPPPPPPLQIKTPPRLNEQSARDYSPISPSWSILSTATSPITPRPHFTYVIDDSPTPKARAPSMNLPTRRPPPPPPSFSDSSSTRSSVPPRLPPRHPPPAFEPRPPHLRHQSNISFGTSSSISFAEKDTLEVKSPVSPWRPRTRLSMTAKPRGPRPPPPPPRPWAKSVASEYHKPVFDGEDKMSESPLFSPKAEEAGRGSALQSTSPLEHRSGVSRERSIEYTDLDVIMARLEGTGREYEVRTTL
jgi:hypothetical protein